MFLRVFWLSVKGDTSDSDHWLYEKAFSKGNLFVFFHSEILGNPIQLNEPYSWVETV